MAIAKCFTTIGALFMLVFGVAIVSGTAYLWIHDQIFLDNSNIKYTFLGIALTVGIIVIVGAADGIYGICKVKACHLCVFQIFVIFCMLLFISIAVVLVFTPEMVFEGTCTQSKNPVIEQANTVYLKSAQMFCVTGACSCALDVSNPKFAERYTPSQQAEIDTYNKDTINGFKSSDACIKESLKPEQASLFQVIGNLQELLQCSLWCPEAGYTVSNLIYRFKDVNDGKPQYYCYTRLQYLFDQFKDGFRWAFTAAGIIMALMFICNMYLCCCAKGRKGKDLQRRFLYYTQEYGQPVDKYDRGDYYERKR